MYASFQNLVEPEDNASISQLMIDYFNSTVPDGFEYRTDGSHDKMCCLIAEKGHDLTVSGCEVMLTEQQKKMLGDEPVTPELVMKLLDNALEWIELDGKNATLQLSQKQLPFGYLVKTAKDGRYASKGRLFVSGTPIEFDLPLACDDNELIVHFVQVRSGSPYTRSFSGQAGALCMSISMNVKTQALTCRYSFDNTRESSAGRCLEAAVIFDGINNGSTEIKGFGKINPDCSREAAVERAPFWKKVVDLEAAFDVNFDTSAVIDRMTAINIERLHRCVCEGKAVGLGYKPDSITITTDGSTLDYHEGMTARLISPGHEKLAIFGMALEVDSNTGLSGIVLGKVEPIDSTHYRIPITYIDDFQCSIIYFSPSEEANDDEEPIRHISEVLFAPLPNGARY